MISALEFWADFLETLEAIRLYSRQSHGLGRHLGFQGHSKSFPQTWTKWLCGNLGSTPRGPRNLHSVFEQESVCPSRPLLGAGTSVVDTRAFSLF